jgi:hypothetical protein
VSRGESIKARVPCDRNLALGEIASSVMEKQMSTFSKILKSQRTMKVEIGLRKARRFDR